LPRGISADWLKNLPPGQYVSLSDVVELLAFGRNRLPIGLSAIDEHAARLSAGLALIRAGKEANGVASDIQQESKFPEQARSRFCYAKCSG